MTTRDETIGDNLMELHAISDKIVDKPSAAAATINEWRQKLRVLMAIDSACTLRAAAQGIYDVSRYNPSSAERMFKIWAREAATGDNPFRAVRFAKNLEGDFVNLRVASRWIRLATRALAKSEAPQTPQTPQTPSGKPKVDTVPAFV